MKVRLIPLLALGLAGAAGADDILLLDGRTLVGIARPEADRWVIRTRFGDLGLPRAEVRSVTIRRTSLHDYDDRLAAFCGCPSASEAFDLALWSRQKGLVRYVNGLLKLTLEIDPDHAEARRLLGFSWQEGTWRTSSEIDDLCAAKDATPKAAPRLPAPARPRRSPSLETTPYGLGIPMTQARPDRRFRGGGGYSLWQGPLPTHNLLNLPPVRRGASR